MTAKKLSQSKEELEKAIRDTIEGISEVLAKSGHPMGDAKEDSHSESHGADKMAKAEGEDEDEDDKDDLEKMDPNDGLAQEEYESPDEADTEMDMEAEGAPEGAEGDDGMAEMQEHISSMSDEELGALIEMLTQEQETRGSGEMGEPGMEADPGMEMEADPAMEAPPPEMEKNYKQDYLKLTKSVAGINGAIEKLAGAVEKISGEVTAIKKNRAKTVTSKAAVSRRSEALEKSDRPARVKERLSKSETQDFLLNEVRKGNPQVNRQVMIDLNYVEGDSQLATFQDGLTKQGVKFPEL